MPPNAGDTAYTDFLATFDTRTVLDPKQSTVYSRLDVTDAVSNDEPASLAVEKDKIYFSYADVHETISCSVPYIQQFNPEVIISINGGGNIASQILHAIIPVPILPVTFGFLPDVTTGSKAVKLLQWFDESSDWAQLVRNGRVLIVNDMDDTRQILEYCVNEVFNRYHPHKVATAVVHQKEKEKVGVLPRDVEQFSGQVVPDLELCYPWNASAYGNSIKVHEAKARQLGEADVAPEKLSKEEFIKKLLSEEEARQCFTAEHMEDQLVEDSKKRSTEEKEEEYESVKQVGNSENYWDWCEDSLKEDIQQSFTVIQIEKGLVEDSKRRLSEKEIECETSVHAESADGYWDWKEEKEEVDESVPAPKEINKEEFLKQILLEEEIRQITMVDSVEKKLIEESKRRLAEEKESEYETADHADSDSYWDWSEGSLREEIRKDLSVNQVQKNLIEESKRRLAEEKKQYETCMPTESKMGYWDWKEEKEEASEISACKEVNMDVLVKNILLEEEIRQSMKVENVEKRLVEESKKRLAEQVVENEAAVQIVETNNYWDW